VALAGCGCTPEIEYQSLGCFVFGRTKFGEALFEVFYREAAGVDREFIYSDFRSGKLNAFSKAAYPLGVMVTARVPDSRLTQSCFT